MQEEIQQDSTLPEEIQQDSTIQKEIQQDSTMQEETLIKTIVTNVNDLAYTIRFQRSNNSVTV